MTPSWLLIQKSAHGKLLGIPAVRWAVSLALTLVVFLILRVLVTAARSRLKARSGLTETRRNDYLPPAPPRTHLDAQPPGWLRVRGARLRGAEGGRGCRGILSCSSPRRTGP